MFVFNITQRQWIGRVAANHIQSKPRDVWYWNQAIISGYQIYTTLFLLEPSGPLVAIHTDNIFNLDSVSTIRLGNYSMLFTSLPFILMTRPRPSSPKYRREASSSKLLRRYYKVKLTLHGVLSYIPNSMHYCNLKIRYRLWWYLSLPLAWSYCPTSCCNHITINVNPTLWVLLWVNTHPSSPILKCHMYYSTDFKRCEERKNIW